MDLGVGWDMVKGIIDILVVLVILGGVIFTGWGAIALFTSLSQNHGQDISNGIWKIVGGVGIIAVAGILKAFIIDPALAPAPPIDLPCDFENHTQYVCYVDDVQTFKVDDHYIIEIIGD